MGMVKSFNLSGTRKLSRTRPSKDSTMNGIFKINFIIGIEIIPFKLFYGPCIPDGVRKFHWNKKYGRKTKGISWMNVVNNAFIG